MLSWVEIDTESLAANIGAFRALVPAGVALQAVVKSNAYGHGLEIVARRAAAEGIEMFGVHAIEEATELRQLGLDRPILLLGYLGAAQAREAVESGAEITVYNPETLDALSRAAVAAGRSVRCHVKVETGVHRQGILPEELDSFVDRLLAAPGLALAGVSTHFANIEDTTDRAYARLQLGLFRELGDRIRSRVPEAIRHCACSAAVLTLPETSFDMVRVGIGLYGIWPSKETLLSCLLEGRKAAALRPVLAWKARIAQIKTIPAGSYVGYGCTHRTTRTTRLAVVPIGYADGLDRRLSGVGHLLVCGARAPILGRICMNLTMVDVTDIPEAALEGEAVVIGRQGPEEITAAQVASLCNTIPYEIVSRISPRIPRLAVATAPQ